MKSDKIINAFFVLLNVLFFATLSFFQAEYFLSASIDGDLVLNWLSTSRFIIFLLALVNLILAFFVYGLKKHQINFLKISAIFVFFIFLLAFFVVSFLSVSGSKLTYIVGSLTLLYVYSIILFIFSFKVRKRLVVVLAMLAAFVLGLELVVYNNINYDTQVDALNDKFEKHVIEKISREEYLQLQRENEK